MIAELIVTYFLISNQPAYINQSYGPKTQAELALRLQKTTDYGLYFEVKPYLLLSEPGLYESGYVVPRRVGGELDIGFDWSWGRLVFYHHSIHNLDYDNLTGATELDGIKFTWKLSK